jgi:hypothetical protein
VTFYSSAIFRCRTTPRATPQRVLVGMVPACPEMDEIERLNRGEPGVEAA